MSFKFEPACRRMEWLDPFYKSVWEKAFADAIPISGTLELTPRCNFDCKMCYVHLKEKQIPLHGKELTAQEWIQIAGEAKKAGTTWLCITGGEPFLHPEFEEIYTTLSRMGFFITLQTNASLISGKNVQLLEKYPPRCIKLTLYGSNDAVYQDVCGIANGFTNVDRGIQKIKKLGIPMQMVGTIIRQNEKDMKNMFLYALENGVYLQMTKEIKPSVRSAKKSCKEIRIEKEQGERWKEFMKMRLEKKPVNIERKPCTYCKDYRLGYWVTWDGMMRFCSFMDRPDIPVLENGFQKSWSRLIEYEESLQWPKECFQCKANKICLKCSGMLNAECGGPDKVTEQFCRRYKKLFE